MAYKYNSLFTSIGRAIDGLANSVHVAREISGLFNTQEAVFRARGTTRDAEIRAAAKRF